MKIAEIKKNIDNNQWECFVNGKRVLKNKTLSSLKACFKMSLKLKKMGISVANIEEKNKIEVWDSKIPGKRGRKPSSTPKVVRKEILSNKIEVVGTGSLEGLKKTGKVVGKKGNTLILEFESKKSNMSCIQEFDLKTGFQITDSPYHIWKIA